METSHYMEGNQQWFAVNVASRHEKSVSHLLANKEYETFLPVHTRQHEYGGRLRKFEIPLFPGYVFCRLDPAERLPVMTTPGVIRLAGVGRVPEPVADEEITALQKVMAAKASLTPHEYWKTGERGTIAGGPLRGLEGIIVSAKNPVKLLLSVSLLQRSVLVELDADFVMPLDR